MRWDIFCAVVDNFGDIGVCWRLARQLVAEHGFAVRLWVDDLASFSRLCPQLDPLAPEQKVGGVEVHRWHGEFPADVVVADVVVEAFACHLPEPYVAAMAARRSPPVWINLEYLSAEHWVEGCHAMASPHPRLPLVKHFFFPGFGPNGGGLLRERDLIARREAFTADARASATFWRDAGFAPPERDALVVSLFGYCSPAVRELLQALSGGDRAVVCALPESELVPAAADFFGCGSLQVGQEVGSGGLVLRVLPFVEQDRYDKWLWASDLNFVRGEDSFVRAQWAARPMVWQIYAQAEDAHWAKLEAFRAIYCAGLGDAATAALSGMWQAWNRGAGVAAAWTGILSHLTVIRAHAQEWARGLATQPDLATRLTDFCQTRLK